MKTAALFLLTMAAAHAAPFLITYTLTPGVTAATLTPEQKKIFMEHGARFVKMQATGVAYTGGHTTGPDNILGIAIVEAKDEAAARAMAANDPAVEAGLLKWTAQPFAFLVPTPAPTVHGSESKSAEK